MYLSPSSDAKCEREDLHWWIARNSYFSNTGDPDWSFVHQVKSDSVMWGQNYGDVSTLRLSLKINVLT
jgi:hypothetical protein